MPDEVKSAESTPAPTPSPAPVPGKPWEWKETAKELPEARAGAGYASLQVLLCDTSVNPHYFAAGYFDPQNNQWVTRAGYQRWARETFSHWCLMEGPPSQNPAPPQS